MDEPLNIDLFIFDWSGTISDDRKPVYAANMRLFDDYKIPRISFEEWLPKTQATTSQYLEVNHGIGADEKETSERYTKYYNEEIARGNIPTVYQSAELALLYLYNREKPLAVLSSHPEQNLTQEAASYKLLNYFDLLIGNVGTNGKAGGILTICKKLGKKPESTLYIGDTVHDIQAAKNAGVYSAGVCGGYTLQEKLEREEPDFILPDLNLLEGLFLIGKLQ
jgi:HAD superfamily hydrolase (TIGR01549 family)